MKTNATKKFTLKRLALSVIVATTAFGGTAALSQTAVNGKAASQAVSESSLSSEGNNVSAFGNASANAQGNANVQTSDVAKSTKTNGKTIAQAGAITAANIKGEAKNSILSNTELVGEAASAIQVRGNADSVAQVTSVVKADQDNVSVDAGTLSESNLGVDVSLADIKGSAKTATGNTVESGSNVEAGVTGLVDSTLAASSDLVNDTATSADVSGNIDAAAQLQTGISQTLAENTEAEVDSAIIDTANTLRGGINTAFQTGADVSAQAQATAESATSVGAGVDSDALEAEGSLVSEFAAQATAAVDGESELTSELSGTLDDSVADVGTQAVAATDIVSESSADLNSDISSSISSEAATDLDATARDVEEELSGSSALDLTGNL